MESKKIKNLNIFINCIKNTISMIINKYFLEIYDSFRLFSYIKLVDYGVVYFSAIFFLLF